MLKKHSFIILGWFFVLLAIIGVILPLIPTTPFLILALYLFAKSSPTLHQKLLHNRWFGSSLQQWEKNKTISRSAKRKALLLIVASFAISIALLQAMIALQIMLVIIAAVLLTYIWRLKEA